MMKTEEEKGHRSASTINEEKKNGRFSEIKDFDGSAMSSDTNKNRLYGPNLISFDSHSMVSRYLKECRSGKGFISAPLGPSVSSFNFC